MRRLAIPLLLTFTAIALALAIPQEVAYLRPVLHVLTLWPDGDAQREAQLPPGFYQALTAAETRIPPAAGVLLVTAGRDPRHSEYVAFHRALYHLAPRPVWWMNAAVPDGTWESRWWIASPGGASDITRLAAERHIAFVLFHGLPPPRDMAAPDRLTSDTWLVAVTPGSAMSPTRALRPSAARVLFGAAASVVIILIAGLLIVATALRGAASTRIEMAALAWPIGCGAISFAMFGLSLIGVSLSRQAAGITAAVLAWAAVHAARVYGARRHRERITVRRPPPESTRAWIAGLLVCTVVALLWVGVVTLGRPLTVWDSWVNWALKARIIHSEAGVTPVLVADPSRTVTLPNYPLLIPLVEAWTYQWAGSSDDRLAGLQAVLFFAAVPGLSWALMRRFGAPVRRAAVVAMVAVSMPTVWRTAAGVTADAPMAVYACITGGFLALWCSRGVPGALTIAMLAGAMLPWTKTEGTVLLIAIAAGTLLCGRGKAPERRAVFRTTATAALALAPWIVFEWRHAVPTSVFLPLRLDTFIGNADRLPYVGWRMLANICRADGAFVWLVAAPLMVVAFRQGARQRDALIVSAAIYLLAMACAYVFSDYLPYQRHVLASVDRLMSHVVPLVLLWIGLAAVNPHDATSS